MTLCPNCGKKGLDPIIRSKPYLIIKESVTENEYEQGILFTLNKTNKWGHSENTTSYYLAKELSMVGINMQSLSLTALWLHTPPKSKRSKDDKEHFQKCLDWSISEVLRAAEGKKIILVMGAEATRTLTGYGVSEVSGLICQSDLLPKVPVIVPCPNPDNIMKMPLGEMRNALKVFKEQIQIYEQYAKV